MPTKSITPEPPDIPDDLTPCDPTQITDAAAIDQRAIIAAPSTPISARAPTFDQSKLTASALTGSILPASRWTDWTIESADLSNATWIDCRMVRVHITNTKLTGFDARGAELRDIHFKDCKAPDILLAESTLTRIRFDHCQLTNLDLTGATIKSLAINHCDSRNIRLINTKIEHLDLRDSLIEGIALNQSTLKGILINPPQAPAIAQALGVQIAGNK